MDDELIFRVDADEAGKRLDQLLARRIGIRLGLPVSRNDARWLLGTGCVHAGGRRIERSSAKLDVGTAVAVRDLTALAERIRRRSQTVDVGAERVAYEDDALLIVDKPEGLPTHATRDPSRDDLLSALGRLLRDRDGEAPDLVAYHRLDRPTSGLIVIGKDPVVHAAMSAAFAERRVDKRYLAVVERDDLPPRWEQTDRIETERGRSRTVTRGGRSARTELRVRSVRSPLSLVEARPITGRTHQIRLHLAAAGAPILGDRVYGGSPAGRLMLHAHRIALPHPVSGEPIVVEAALPEGWPADLWPS